MQLAEVEKRPADALNWTVWARICERASPAEYLEAAQDAELLEAMMPAALKQLREESYENQLRPLPVATAQARANPGDSVGTAHGCSSPGVKSRHVRQGPGWRIVSIDQRRVVITGDD